jgi:hypothetical protein
MTRFSLKLDGSARQEIYYHALYNLVAHWAAYVGMMAASLTMTALVSTGGRPKSVLGTIGLGGAMSLAGVGAGYCVRGMGRYAGVVREALPLTYLSRVSTFSNKTVVLLGTAAAVGLWLANLSLLWFVPHGG